MTYQVVFLRSGRDMETLYWNATLCEIKKLARTIALERGADRFQIIEFDDGGAEIYSEQRPFGEATRAIDRN